VTSFLEIWQGILRTCDGYFDRRETVDETIDGEEMRVLTVEYVEYRVSSSRKIDCDRSLMYLRRVVLIELVW